MTMSPPESGQKVKLWSMMLPHLLPLNGGVSRGILVEHWHEVQKQLPGFGIFMLTPTILIAILGYDRDFHQFLAL